MNCLNNPRCAVLGVCNCGPSQHAYTPTAAKAGPNGALALTWHDGKRPRIAVAYVGEDGIKPDVFYRLDGAGKFVEVA